MQLGELVTLLDDTKNKPCLLEGSRRGKRVVVAPRLVGRVMGSSISGKRGEVAGRIHRSAIERGPVDPMYNNYGGEEMFLFCPEGGQFGFNFGQHLGGWEHYAVQDCVSRQPFRVLVSSEASVVMRSRFPLVNAAGTPFLLEVTRTIRILDTCPFILGHGDTLDFVGFESENVVRNVNSLPIRRDGGAPGVWLIGHFAGRPRSIVMVPFRRGSRQKMGIPIREEYFPDFCLGGKLPWNRWAVGRDVALFKADGKVRGKIGVGRQRALPRLGCLDLDSDHLVIVDYDLHPELEYAASYWRRLADPYDGDANCVYLDGPESKDGPPGDAYELETMSPALFLSPGEAFTYRSRTFRLFGPRPAIGEICQRFFRVTRAALEEFAATL